MPTYVSKCPNCKAQLDYYKKVADRDDTPLHCGVKSERKLVAPMVQAMTITQGIVAADGNTYYGKSEYEAYLKKNDLLPASELKGEAQYRRKQINAEYQAGIEADVDKAIVESGIAASL